MCVPMRPLASVLVALLLVASSMPTQATTPGAVVISEVHPRPNADGREFIELHNAGDASLDLAGWNLTDGINTFTFPSWTLPADGFVVVWGGGNASALGPTWKPNVWNNGGDLVQLLRPDGSVAHQMEYGSAEVPVPGEGMSLHGPQWNEGTPTPGQDPEGQHGSATATVQDVPPDVEWVSPPSSVRPGANASLTFEVHDANGDPVQWVLQLDGIAFRNGTTAGTHQVNATAPDAPGDWTWTLTVESTTHQVTRTVVVPITTGPFRIELPPEGIHFPDLWPGDTEVAASASFALLHVGEEPAVPHLDLSPFRGDQGELPVDANVHLLIDQQGTITAADYQGPLQALPNMSPGDRWTITLVLKQVPDQLQAGEYRSSFTVVE